MIDDSMLDQVITNGPIKDFRIKDNTADFFFSVSD
jgi:hypothetical protein